MISHGVVDKSARSTAVAVSYRNILNGCPSVGKLTDTTNSFSSTSRSSSSRELSVRNVNHQKLRQLAQVDKSAARSGSIDVVTSANLLLGLVSSPQPLNVVQGHKYKH
mmetsp:Transcript_19759/g.33578  ORF Transcript_19759/g.33578 Transcript_19759/m.33578 type:complete len:108 (+) Transcript_19759:736-1059(+)